MEKVFLPEDWTLSGDRIGIVPAKVPGCVHTDLMRQGIIENLYWRDNNKKYQWIENEDWTYCCKFDADTEKSAELVFEGLDTYADIYLNCEHIGSADNMFLSYRFDVTGKLQQRDNYLEVRFRSPIREVSQMPKRKAAFTSERLNTRRMQCTYGWDWVDRFVTSGVFRPVYLRYGRDMYVENMYIYTENIDTFGAQIRTQISFANYDDGEQVKLSVFSPLGEIVAAMEFYADQPVMVRRLDIPAPQLWYPNGYGEQPLYKLVVQIGKNRIEETFGIRTVKIMQLPDEPGSIYWKKAIEAQKTEIGKINSHNQRFSGFQIVINGKKILCKGANWVPCEPFPSAETEEKLVNLVQLAKKMNANFLRIWGGGVPEKHAFYDACDRAGIVVAHDFMMACGEYPEKESWFIEALEKESAYIVQCLRNHPCIAWWHGDNENAVEGSDTQQDYCGRDTALRGIAPQIYRLDPMRQFLPSSPYGGDTYGSVTCGTTHNSNYCGNIFQYFYEAECTDYKEFLQGFSARFISEEPTFGAASIPSLKKFLSTWDIFEDDAEEMLLYHSKNNPALERHLYGDVRSFTEKVLGQFQNGADRIFKYQYIQYEWVRVLFENCRREQGYCNGQLFWMFNDCWPAALGWSLVDYYGLPKASFYSFKRCAKPQIGVLDRVEEGYVLTVANDTSEQVETKITAYLLDMEDQGKRKASCVMTCRIPGYSTQQVELPWSFGRHYMVISDISCGAVKDRCFYKFGKLHLHNVEDGLRIMKRTDSYIDLKANQYIHAVALEGSYLFDNNYFSLMRGECTRIYFEATGNEQTDITVAAYTL